MALLGALGAKGKLDDEEEWSANEDKANGRAVANSEPRPWNGICNLARMACCIYALPNVSKNDRRTPYLPAKV